MFFLEDANNTFLRDIGHVPEDHDKQSIVRFEGMYHTFRIIVP
jgi:hypothetical protein